MQNFVGVAKQQQQNKSCINVSVKFAFASSRVKTRKTLHILRSHLENWALNIKMVYNKIAIGIVKKLVIKNHKTEKALSLKKSALTYKQKRIYLKIWWIDCFELKKADKQKTKCVTTDGICKTKWLSLLLVVVVLLAMNLKSKVSRSVWSLPNLILSQKQMWCASKKLHFCEDLQKSTLSFKTTNLQERINGTDLHCKIDLWCYTMFCYIFFTKYWPCPSKY